MASFFTLSPPNFIQPKTHHLNTPVFFSKPIFFTGNFRPLTAIGRDGKFYPDPLEYDPPEAPEDSSHDVSKFQQVHRVAAKARKIEEDDRKKNQSTYLAAIAEDETSSGTKMRRNSGDDDGDDLFGERDKAIAMKRDEFVKQGLLEPKKESVFELEPQEVVDLEEIEELQGLRAVEDEEDSNEEKNVNGKFDTDAEVFDSTGRAEVAGGCEENKRKKN